MLVLVLQMVVQTLQAQIAPPPLGQGQTEFQACPLLNIRQILKNNLLLQGHRGSTEHNGLVQTLSHRNGRQTVGGGFTGAGTRLNHGYAISISR